MEGTDFERGRHRAEQAESECPTPKSDIPIDLRSSIQPLPGGTAPYRDDHATVGENMTRVTRALALIAVLPLITGGVRAEDSNLQALLDRTAEWAEAFWQDLGSVSCVETMEQSKIGDKGKILSQQSSVYDYVIVSAGKPGRPMIEESRLLQKATGKSRPMAFLVTSGFSVLSLVFHPYYQGSFQFSLAGEDTIDGRQASKIGFSQIPGTRPMTALRVRGRLYPLHIKGQAWVDAGNGAILKIQSSLLEPKLELGLVALNSSVAYAPVRFKPSSKSCWVPVEAAVEARTQRQHWRNVHQFAAHKYFTVTSESSVLP